MDVANAESVPAQRNYLIAKTADFTLMFANKLWLKTVITVTRGVNFHIAIIGDNGLAANAVKAVASVLTRAGVLVITLS